jgi:hypothetical protein
MTEKRDVKDDLKPSTGDYVYAGVKAGLSTIPVYGGAITNTIFSIIPSPLEKRRTKWFVDFDQRLQLLEEMVEGFSSKDLAENENFISIFLYATNIAIRTHQQEKLEALRNAVTNSILHSDIDESLQLMYLNLIDRYTPWHLIILQFLENPRQYGESRGKKYPNWSMGGTATVLEYTFPELKGRRTFYDLIVKELFAAGFLHSETFLHATLSDLFAPETTEMGKQFLQYISNPLIIHAKKE